MGRIVLVALSLMAGAALAADDPKQRQDLTAVIALHGKPCGEVVSYVVQGENDPFGIAPPGPNRTVTRIPGTHSLRNSGAVAEAVSEWLARLGW